jgi:glycosyltransferase involved in cell wall biosynthesis
MKQGGLAVVITHPIQYYAPLFVKMQLSGVRLRIFYTKDQDKSRFDHGFGRTVAWDIPLLEGYDYVFQPAGTKAEQRLLIRQIESFKPKAVLIIGWSPAGHLPLMRYFKGRIPVWFRGDSTLLDETPGLKQWARRLFLRWVYRYVDLAFYVGTQNKRYFVAHGLKEVQLVFAPHAVDNERFQKAGFVAAAKEWRDKLGYLPTDKLLVFAGKLEPKKAPELLIRAVLSLNSPHVKVLLVGNGILESALKERYGNNSQVKFVDFVNQSEMPMVYRLGDIFCLPSQGPGETWGLAINEAMACGRAIIASDRCGAAVDLIHAEENGEVFLAGSIADLAEKIKKLLTRDLAGMGKKSAVIIHAWSFEAQIISIKKQLNAYS